MGPCREEVINTKQEGQQTCSEVQAPLKLILAWKLGEFELRVLEGVVKICKEQTVALE